MDEDEVNNGVWSFAVEGEVHLSIEEWCTALSDLNETKIEADANFAPIQDTMWCATG